MPRKVKVQELESNPKKCDPVSDVAKIDFDELAFSSGGAYFKIQEPLIHLIEDFLQNHPIDGKKMTRKAFCEKADISVPNLTAITNGNRWVAKCSREIIEKIAKTLKIPVLQVYTMSGFIRPEDIAHTTDIDETVDAIYRKMKKDSRMTIRVPSRDVWDAWPMSAKLTVCMMYEALIEKVLLRYANFDSGIQTS